MLIVSWTSQITPVADVTSGLDEAGLVAAREVVTYARELFDCAQLINICYTGM